MLKWIPNTQEVKKSYVRQERNRSVWVEGERKAKEEFDAWLAEHDTQVASMEREKIINIVEAEIVSFLNAEDAVKFLNSIKKIGTI